MMSCDSSVIQRMALPLHIQRLERVLDVNSYLCHLEGTLNKDEQPVTVKCSMESKDVQFNFTNITPERQWIKDLLLSSDTDDSDVEISEADKLRIIFELKYKQRVKWRSRLKRLSKIRRYQYFSAGLLLPEDKYPEICKRVEAEKRKTVKQTSKRVKEEIATNDFVKKEERYCEDEYSVPFQKEPQQDPDEYRKNLWNFIVKKEIPKMAKLFSQSRHITMSNNKKVAVYCQREVRRWAAKSQRQSKEVNSVQPRARKVTKEVISYWRKYEKVEKEARKKAEKEAQEQQKLYDEMREARRQQRKLNFLITQTELYAHFMSKKFTGGIKSTEDILKNLEDQPMAPSNMNNIPQAVLTKIDETDDYDTELVKAHALNKVQAAVERHKVKHDSYVEAAKGKPKQDSIDLQQSFDQNFSLANPALSIDQELAQPSIFRGQLKAYQLKGMNWLASLYDQGINGILADEMGLGKTVQSIALLAHLAEHQNIWGPFLIVSPASTLHNWQQECTRFVDSFKVLPYWGNPHERKVIRKYWNQKLLCHRNAPFHVLITSYQLVVQDIKYFQRLKWQYMILDEAQAIKSSSSVRWKLLMSFNCRNRLLLTGTPIQNTMAELWALLHFIMPTMFDSHDEFSEWFSKDIENHAEKKSALDENQLSRLHMILKPFMLRRIKKDVEHEMAEKIEVRLSCSLSSRQRELYYRLKERISIDDLLKSSLSNSSKDSTSTLMNIVMQFRKVCNHPDLFERRDVSSPINLSLPSFPLPRIVYHQCIRPLNKLHQRLLIMQLGVVSSHHISSSSLNKEGCGLWSFSRLFDLSPSESSSLFIAQIPQRIELLFKMASNLQLLYLHRLYNKTRAHKRHQLVLHPFFNFSLQSLNGSSLLSSLVFTSHTSTNYTHTTHHIVTPIKEHLTGISLNITDITTSATDGYNNLETTQYRHCQLTSLPVFIQHAVEPKVHSQHSLYYIPDPSAHYYFNTLREGGTPQIKHLFKNGCVTKATEGLWLTPPTLGGLEASRPLRGWSHINIPNKEKMITDSDKMVVLDKLLAKLKKEGHRVLVYSQMTKMIDLLEEFMSYRHHKYIRLDGSSRISERRDMVDDFQTKTDIFVFLLSTRAGGLGINLTAADTVIFYDSDWNPTVDQQAMDRAHRLGQTKQVTVYRLIVKGSIEERILQRAHEKSEIQKMVISGGDFKIDTLKPKEVVSLLLDDEEMESRFLTKQAEKKAQEDVSSAKPKNTRTRKRKNTQKHQPSEGMPTPKKAPPTHSIASSSPSAAPSVTSLATNNNNDTLNNGDYIDVVSIDHEGGGIPPPPHSNTSNNRSHLGKRSGGRSGKTKGGSGVTNKRIKVSSKKTTTSRCVPSPSTGTTNSVPSSPLSSSLHVLSTTTATSNGRTSPLPPHSSSHVSGHL